MNNSNPNSATHGNLTPGTISLRDRFAAAALSNLGAVNLQDKGRPVADAPAATPLHAIEQLWADESQWSQATFGSDRERGPVGALKHLASEAEEALADPDDITEYADCLLLILDATRRGGWTLEMLIDAAREKLELNKTRTWSTPISATEPVMHAEK